MIVGEPPGFTSAMLFPATSAVTLSAKVSASTRHVRTATGTSLGSLLLPVGALGAWQYYKNGHVNVTASLLIALGLFVGAYFGAQFAQGLDPATAKRLFAVFLVAVAVRIWLTAA